MSFKLPREFAIAHFDLSDFEWAIIELPLPAKAGGDPRIDDRQVINGILQRLLTGAPRADNPQRYGSHMTCCNWFVRWRKARV